MSPAEVPPVATGAAATAGTAVAGGAATRSAALLARVDRLEDALVRGGDRIPAEVADTVRRGAAAVRSRVAAGVDHTVVALVGGTGSGKSSLFNALTGLPLAEVGARRPTTSAATACAWSHVAGRVLDRLGVAPDRRLDRESVLDGEREADLRGLVLLDLPDHDSVAGAHREVVDRLLPLVDLLVWVVDPQKYADDALHAGYLQALAGHEGAMLVVLNQVDTLPPGARDGVLADVARLLREDGLAPVGVHAVSATTGEGVADLRAVLARAVAGHGVAELRALAEVGSAAAAHAAVVGDAEPDTDRPVELVVDALLEAAGVPALVSAVRAGAAEADARPGPAQADGVAAARRQWLSSTTRGLPVPWARAVEDAVAPPEELAAATGTAVVDTLGARPAGRREAAGLLGVATLALVAAVALGARAVAGGGAIAITGCVVAAALAGVVLLGAQGAARRGARSRAAALDAAARAAVTQVVTDHLATPTRAVLDDHRVVREATAGPASPDRPAGSVPG